LKMAENFSMLFENGSTLSKKKVKEIKRSYRKRKKREGSAREKCIGSMWQKQRGMPVKKPDI
jgi:hypothetical protein